MISVGVRLHHDFTVLQDENIPSDARTLVAMVLVADHFVAMHEGVQEQKEWVQYGAVCLSYLNVNEAEVDAWVDTLHPMFESAALA
jgi:hypothetical protein